MNTSHFDTIAAIAAALTEGAILLAPKGSVGPFREACGPDGRFACLDTSGEVVPSLEAWKELEAVPWGIDFDTRYQQDWTAFGAAVAFVTTVGPEAAKAALNRVLDPWGLFAHH